MSFVIPEDKGPKFSILGRSAKKDEPAVKSTAQDSSGDLKTPAGASAKLVSSQSTRRISEPSTEIHKSTTSSTSSTSQNLFGVMSSTPIGKSSRKLEHERSASSVQSYILEEKPAVAVTKRSNSISTSIDVVKQVPPVIAASQTTKKDTAKTEARSRFQLDIYTSSDQIDLPTIKTSSMPDKQKTPSSAPSSSKLSLLRTQPSSSTPKASSPTPKPATFRYFSGDLTSNSLSIIQLKCNNRNSIGCNLNALTKLILRSTTSLVNQTGLLHFGSMRPGASTSSSSSSSSLPNKIVITAPSATELQSSSSDLIGTAFDGLFFDRQGQVIVSGSANHISAIRIGAIDDKIDEWPLSTDCEIMAGNSILKVIDLYQEDDETSRDNPSAAALSPTSNRASLILKLSLLGKNKEYLIRGDMVGVVGRSPDSVILLDDRDVSRKHCKITYDIGQKCFVVSDLSSTNGTYIRLTGPYSQRLKILLQDQIRVDKAQSYLVSRFDYGRHENKGSRPTMEDRAIVIQDLLGSVGGDWLASAGLSPVSFAGVFDGHGGQAASTFLFSQLASHVAGELNKCLDQLKSALTITSTQPTSQAYDFSSSSSVEEEEKYVGVLIHVMNATNDQHTLIDGIMTSCLKRAFLAADEAFLHNSSVPEVGSTAATIIMLGQYKLYCANTGDSRTVMCRDGASVPLSEDHNPHRLDEKNRVESCGGRIENNRINNTLSVTRAFGDAEFKIKRAIPMTNTLKATSEDGASTVKKPVSATAASRPKSRPVMASGRKKTQAMSLTSSQAKLLKSAMAADDDGGLAGSSDLRRIVEEADVDEAVVANIISPMTQQLPIGKDELKTLCATFSYATTVNPIVTAEPDVVAISVSARDEFILIACDGLYESYSIADALTYVRNAIREEVDVQVICEELTEAAIKKGSTDNVSIVIIKF